MCEKLTSTEQGLLLEVLNGAIAYRLNAGTRRSEIQPLKEIKRKSGITEETIRQAYLDEQEIRQEERLAHQKVERKAKKSNA